MATPIGTNVINSVTRRYIVNEITDNVYGSNVFFFRLNKAKKKLVQGGFQLEAPLMYARFTAGGPYSGYDTLTVTPSDTTKNGAWDWKQYYVPVVIDGLTMIKADSPEAIANFIVLQNEQAQMEMAEWLATGLFSNGVSNVKNIDGLQGVVDDGTVLPTYAGLARASNTWWNAQIDSATTTLTLSALNSFYGTCSSGGRKPTLILSRQGQYNRYWSLLQSQQRFAAGLEDEQLGQAGFTNLTLNGTPWVVDSHVFDGANSSNSAILFLNENYFHFGVSPRGDFYMEDFQTPVNQDAAVAKLLWAGNLLCTNCQRQGKMTAVVA